MNKKLKNTEPYYATIKTAEIIALLEFAKKIQSSAFQFETTKSERIRALSDFVTLMRSM